MLLDALPIAGRRVLDLGCNVGALSLGLALHGARQVIGYDRDRDSLAVARAAAQYLGLADRTEFHEATIGPDFIRRLPEVDLGLWLSQWMWLLEPLGLEGALDLLFEVSCRIPALFFESANYGETEAWMPEYIRSQRAIELLFEASTCYRSIRVVGQDPAWRQRNVLLGSDPELQWAGETATVIRDTRTSVRKAYKPEFIRLLGREVDALERLQTRRALGGLDPVAGAVASIGWPRGVPENSRPAPWLKEARRIIDHDPDAGR